MTLREYIECLNLDRNITISEITYKIDSNIYISIEIFNIFVVDYNKALLKDIYTHITTIEELKDVYFQKTSKDIEILMRNKKLKILNEL